MKNLNRPYGINSVERMSTEQKERPLYLNEAQFRLVHPPKPTDSWKKIEEKFWMRKEIEKEKLKLKNERYELVKQHDDLGKKWEELMKQPPKSIEEAEERAKKWKH